MCSNLGIRIVLVGAPMANFISGEGYSLMNNNRNAYLILFKSTQVQNRLIHRKMRDEIIKTKITDKNSLSFSPL